MSFVIDLITLAFQCLIYFISDCPPAMNISNMIPPFMRNILKCELADNCFGVSCCVKFGFTIPFSSIQINVSFPVWFKMDPCDFRIDTRIGSFKYEEQLLKYEWGNFGYIW
jgi:hypothetical protein